MAVTSVVYTMAAKSMIDKLLDIDSDALKVMLMNGYTPAQDTHQFVSDVKAAGTETTGTAYTAGGKALTGVTFTRAGHVWTLSMNVVTWSAASLTATHAVFYDSTPGTDATNPVLLYWDLGGAQTANGGSFQLSQAAGGLLTMTAQ